MYLIAGDRLEEIKHGFDLGYVHDACVWKDRLIMSNGLDTTIKTEYLFTDKDNSCSLFHYIGIRVFFIRNAFYTLSIITALFATNLQNMNM